MLLTKPIRIRSRKHLAFVGSYPCFICGKRPVQVHHLTHAQPKARGLKTGDQYTIPLCLIHHMAVHDGRESDFWEKTSLEPIEYASSLWDLSCGTEK